MQIPLPDKITIGDKYGPAMAMTDQAEADAYFEACVEHAMRFNGNDAAAAKKVEKQNLGYCAGYYGTETRERVERLFRCAHPIFGSIATNGAPSVADALNAGRNMAQA